MCQHPFELKLQNICLATCISLHCNNVLCGYVHHADQPAQTTIHDGLDDQYERMTDFAVNVLYVLGFVSMGDAHSEAGRLLGLLGLPNDTTNNHGVSVLHYH
jgi:hypothetical protein